MAGISSASTWWINKRHSHLAAKCHNNLSVAGDRPNITIASPTERAALEGVRKGTRAALTTCVVTAIPTVLGARMMSSRARFYMNYTAQASIISAATMAAYFIVSDRATLASAREISKQRILQERQSAKTKL